MVARVMAAEEPRKLDALFRIPLRVVDVAAKSSAYTTILYLLAKLTAN